MTLYVDLVSTCVLCGFAGLLECIIFAVRLTCGCFPCLSFPVRQKASVFIPFGYTGASLLYMKSPRTHLSEYGASFICM